MYQAPLPQEYADLSPEETDARIRAAKEKLGSRLVILGHHYQRDEVIRHADYRGDSYKLARDAASHPEAEFIVFCGVHFMAESADILTAEEQIVILPNLAAGCSMADMANLFQVRKAWGEIERALGHIGEGALGRWGVGALGDKELQLATSITNEPTPQRLNASTPTVETAQRLNASTLEPGDLKRSQVPGVPERGRDDHATMVPVTYINSAANLKAFVGEHGGTVCTSTNAPAAVKWALERGDKVLFFPDQHLGRNTGVKLGYDPDKDMIVWDPFKPLGGNTEEAIRRATFILWKGHCSVHQRFTVEQVVKARRENPEVKVLVHPECPLDVVEASDFNGSTEYIIRTVSEAAPGTAWAIGTEINLVSRLAKEFPDKKVDCLDPQICPCSTMYRIHPSFLLWVLENLVAGNVVNEIKVPERIRHFAREALNTMLSIPR